jgi:hypothetical protein
LFYGRCFGGRVFLYTLAGLDSQSACSAYPCAGITDVYYDIQLQSYFKWPVMPAFSLTLFRL